MPAVGARCETLLTLPSDAHRNVPGDLAADVDGLTCVDIEVKDGLIEAIRPAKLKKNSASSKKGMMGFNTANVFDVAGGIVFPTFADLHTHIGARALDDRSRLCFSRKSSFPYRIVAWPLAGAKQCAVCSAV